MVAEQPWIKEVDINPLLASSERLVALDARVVLHEGNTAVDKLPKLAIRPYPTQYVGSWIAKDKTPLTMRPIRPEDEPLLVKLHETLSDRTVTQRYFHPMLLSQRVAHERLARICFIDYEREIALVAERYDAKKNTREIWGVGRLSKSRSHEVAAFAVLVGDPYQGRGLGTEFLKRLVDVARAEGVKKLVGRISADNERMRGLCKEMGFSFCDIDSGMIEATLRL
jgi:acetyltransferase